MPRRRLPTRLLLLRVLLFAAIGAAATVLVAWGLRLTTRSFPAKPDPVRTLSWWRLPELHEPPQEAESGARLGTTFIHFGWASIDDARSIDQAVIMHGWPLRSLAAHITNRKSANPRDIDDLSAGWRLVRVGTWSKTLPVLPLWPGFLVDTSFWGGAAFIVWTVPGFVRRGVRRRRGRCVRCGYELAGVAVCPECGGAA